MEKRRTIFDLLRHFRNARDGATAIEFALLALPFFMTIFAILETFLALIAEQVIANATETMSRRLSTGQITQTITEAEFRKQFCAEASIIITCSAAEISLPERLYIDLRSFPKFADMPTTMPLKTHSTGRDLDTSQFGFKPGGPGTINMLRVYYRWPVITDFIRPFLTNVRAEGDNIPSDFLIIATDAFVTEEY